MKMEIIRGKVLLSLGFVGATALVSCGDSSSGPGSASNSADGTAYLTGSCTLKETGKDYNTCFMTRSSSSTNTDAQFFCEKVAVGTYSSSPCNPALFARTCEVEGTIKKNGQTTSKTTINYYTKASTTKCPSPGVEKAISAGTTTSGVSPGQTVNPNPASGTLLGSCTNASTNYCYEIFSPYYQAENEKAYCLRFASQTWSETGCLPDFNGMKSPGICNEINISGGQPVNNSYMYGWDTVRAKEFCNPRTLSAQKIIWTPN